MDYLATSAPEPGLPYTALLAGHDTLACGYYLRAAPGSDIDWTRLLAQREALRVSGSRGFEVVSLGDAEFLLQPYGSASGYPLVLTGPYWKIEAASSTGRRFM